MNQQLNPQELHNYACDIADQEPRAARMLAQSAQEIERLRAALALQTMANQKRYQFNITQETWAS